VLTLTPTPTLTLTLTLNHFVDPEDGQKWKIPSPAVNRGFETDDDQKNIDGEIPSEISKDPRVANLTFVKNNDTVPPIGKC
jgi:hypothetical protein